MKRSELAVRAGIGLLGVGALAAIVKLREPAVARAPSVSAAPASASAAPKARERRSGDLAVELRLVDLLDEAVYDAPKLSKATAHLEYWRRMRSPYVGPGGPLGRVVQEVSIVGEGGAHQFSMGLGHGKVWKPDLHIWNMAEGSFYQREAILAPPPARIRYHVTLPPGAVFEAAPAAIGQAAAVRFEVAVKRPGHPREVVARREVKGSGTRRWQDFTVDLSRFGGQTVDLELGTALLKPGRATPVALWGTPVVLAPGASDVPMNVLFFVVDALRGDAIARTHDDATDQRMAHAKHPPFEAWLPRMPEVAPNLDKLADSGVIFTQAFSGATWTRPGTIAMLTGSRSGDLGLGPLSLVPPKAELSRFYRRHPPFLPLLLRPYGVTTRAIVNNFYMAGYAGAGVDMGFEGVVDHRYENEDTKHIADDTIAWLGKNTRRRFALFVNFDSPHSPYTPPKGALHAIPPPPRAPADPIVRKYLAEIHKDDAAIGRVVAALDKLGLRQRTFIVVTADHGETLSRDHDGVPLKLEGGPPISGRFHHLSTIWQETTRVPIIMSYPARLPRGVRVKTPVQTTDIVPTILDLAGIKEHPRMEGRSLVQLARGGHEPDRPVITEGRGTRSIQDKGFRLIVRDRVAQLVREHGQRKKLHYELYDLSDDPGERVNVAQAHPDLVQRLQSELQKSIQSAEARSEKKATGGLPSLRLRFSGAGAAHRVEGSIRPHQREGATPAKLSATLVGLSAASLRRSGSSLQLSFSTRPGALVGVDLVVDPPTTDLSWQFKLDGKPWPATRVYAGGFGLRAENLADGVQGPAGRLRAGADMQPEVDPERDLGLFVTRDRVAHEVELENVAAASQETMQLMKAWGYVRSGQDRQSGK